MKMVKILMVSLLILMIPGVTQCEEMEQALARAFLETEADLELLEINDWAVINREFMTFEEMAMVRDNILELFGAKDENFHTTKEFDDMYRIMDTEGLTSSGDFLRIILHSVMLPEEYREKPQTYLVVNVSGQELSRITDLTEKVSKSIIHSGGQSKISTCLTGSFNGKLTECKLEKVSEKIANYLKVSGMVSYSDECTLNLVGYSPLLPEGIRVMGKDYNINIAMRYNASEDKTYLWMGTPVISSEH